MNRKNVLQIVLFTLCIFFANIIHINAANAYIGVNSSASRVIIGNTFTVNVTISSAVPLGSWEYVIDYNSSVLKYISGEYSVVDYGNGSMTSKTYSYTFKAIASGSGYIGVKSYAGYAWDLSEFGMSSGSKTINVISQSELEASYSKDNALKNITVNGGNLEPVFNKDTKEYTVKLASNIEKVAINAEVNDSRASVSGVGEFDVSEGENKFELIVTAENGSKNSYFVTVIVEDPNPIIVKTTDGQTLTIVKRASSLTKPKLFEEKTETIQSLEIPAFYSEITKITLVGLKDTKGNINLYVYDKEYNTYVLYKEITFNNLTIYPMELKADENFKNYVKKNVKINNEEVDVYKLNTLSSYSIFYGKNVENNKEGFYIYDEINNSVIKYSSEEKDSLNEKLFNYKKIIIILIGQSVILLMIIIFVSTNKRKKMKRLINEIKNKTIVEPKEIIDNSNDEKKLENDITNVKNEKKVKKKDKTEKPKKEKKKNLKNKLNEL